MAVASRVGTVFQRRPRRRRAAMVRLAADSAEAEQSSFSAGTVGMESSISEFVPKVAALHQQAESLRAGELRGVLDSMEALEHTELHGIFVEMDSLLQTLADTIDGMRQSATAIRQRDIKDHFEHLDEAPGAGGDGQTGGSTASTNEGAHDAVDTMMEVHVVGLSHHKASVDVREKLAVPEAEWNQYAQELVEFASSPIGALVPEVAVLSTCNRFELYFASPELKKFAARECVHAFLRKKSGLSREELAPVLFSFSGEEATDHLFEVSSGLDSLVLGEAQILAQVKACHNHSIAKLEGGDGAAAPGQGGKLVTKMLNSGIRIGKLVRTRTNIGVGSVSVSSAAVELMLARAMHDLRKPGNAVNVCILGAGKMSRLLLLALFSKDPTAHVTLVNRSVDKAQAVLDDDLVAARGGENAKVAPMEQMLEIVQQSDVVFAATASTEPILSAADLQTREKPVMLIDISVPRNIAGDCSDVDTATSYSVDDLKKVMQANTEKRQGEVVKAKKLIVEEVSKFSLFQTSQGAVPYLAALQSRAEEIRSAETKAAGKKLRNLKSKETKAVDKLTQRIIDQLFRPIYYSMREDEGMDAKRSKISALREIFKLEPLYKRRSPLAD